MEHFGNKDTQHMNVGKVDGQAEPGLRNEGPRAEATRNLAKGGFEAFTSSVPRTVHSISSECGGLKEGNKGVDTSGWYEDGGHAITASERDETAAHSARLPED